MMNVLAPAGVLARGAFLSLDPAEVRHLHVRRAASGDQVRLLDGRGGIGLGVLSLARKEARIEVTEVQHAPAPAALRLAVAAGDRERFTWLVEKATEAGATDLFPLDTDRSASVAGRIRQEHVDRLAQRALQAIKQCGAPWAPLVHDVMSLGELLTRGFEGRRWLADEQGEVPPARLPAEEELTILVGPEGGWTGDERGAILRAGFSPVVLGPLTMRFETAALAGVVLAAAGRARGGRG